MKKMLLLFSAFMIPFSVEIMLIAARIATGDVNKRRESTHLII